METKVTIGWGVLRILGCVYAVLGAVFLGLGAVLTKALFPENPVGPIFMMIGTPFFLLGLVFLVIEHRKKRRMEGLVEAGYFVWAEIVDCVYNYNISYHNNRHPSQVIACYRAPDGTKHLFRSRNLPTCGARDLIGKSVKVYTRPEDFRNYYVDAQPLLGNYIEH